ncbi:MAG: hypothetical protein R3B70_14285 [Polyangiaceae bacterium]
MFDGALQSCQDAILKEQAVIDAARVRLDAAPGRRDRPRGARSSLRARGRAPPRTQGLSQMGAYPRFESVIPQPVRAISAALPGVGRRPAAASTEGEADDGLFGDDPARPGEEPRPDKPAAIIVLRRRRRRSPRSRTAEVTTSPPIPTPRPIPWCRRPRRRRRRPRRPQRRRAPTAPRRHWRQRLRLEDLLDKKFLAPLGRRHRAVPAPPPPQLTRRAPSPYFSLARAAPDARRALARASP